MDNVFSPSINIFYIFKCECFSFSLNEKMIIEL
jgi:hypothetical protein